MFYRNDPRIQEILNNLKIIQNIHESMGEIQPLPIQEDIPVKSSIADIILERLPNGDYLL